MPLQKIDLAKLSDDELLTLRSDLVARIAERLKDPGTTLTYDRHGSGHSKNSAVALTNEAVINPIRPSVVERPK